MRQVATLKELLILFCKEYVSTRETAIKKLIADAREAAANETKSSAGDKYETTRELMQQEIDMNLARLNELCKQKAILDHIAAQQTGTIVAPGSIVYTSGGNYFIAISAGQATIQGTRFYTISAASPIGLKLLGQIAGYPFDLNGKNIVIEKVA